MRIAIVSDIHGNLTAFEAVLQDLRETSPDLIFHLGDLADAGSSPVEIMDRIRELGWAGVVGNTDEMLAMPETLEEFAGQSKAPASLWAVVREMAAFTRAALGEMAQTEVVARTVHQGRHHHVFADVTVMLQLTSSIEGFLVLSFPERTAAALAKRILADVSAEIDEELTRDCIGEIGNVVAGQAKALLAGTPYHFSFSVPMVIVDAKDIHPPPAMESLIVAFQGDAGEFTLQLFLTL